MDDTSLQIGITIGMALSGKSTGEAAAVSTYVVGTPVKFTLSKDNWNGTRYTLYAYLYAVGSNGVQIGLPSKSSSPNAQAAVKAALTIHSTYNYSGSTTDQPYARLYIVAVEPPERDLEIVIFGLTPVANTVVAAVSEEEE